MRRVVPMLLALLPPLLPTDAAALDLRLALGDGVRGDAERLRTRAPAALERCADGREVEVLSLINN